MHSFARALVADQVVVSATNFLSAIFVARMLGLADFGVFSMALGAAYLALSVFSAFVSSPLQVYLPSVRGSRRPLYLLGVWRLAFFLGLAAAVVAGLISGVVAHYFSSAEAVDLALGVAACAIGMSLHDWVRRLLLTDLMASRAFVIDSASAALRFLLLLVLFAYGEPSVAGVLICYGLSLGAVVIQWGRMRKAFVADKDVVSGRSAVGRTAIRRHIREGRWLLLNALNFWAGAQMVIYLLGAMFGAALVGGVAAAKNLFGVLNILFLALENGLPQVLKRQKADASRIVGKISLYGGVAVAAVIVVMVAVSDWLVPLAFGSDFSTATPYMAWWGAYFLVGFFHRPLVQALRARGRAYSVFVSTFLGTLSIVLFMSAFASLYGVSGAMLSLVLSQVVILSALYASFKRVPL